MLAVISPAKKLDFETEALSAKHSQPEFLEQSEVLVEMARGLNRSDLARTMKLSDKLADLNYRRFQAFSTPFTTANAKQAALAFNGDTYVGLDAGNLDKDDMVFAQDHLRILSGLYGLLRPLDLIQPYRLEMGARFQPPHGNDLYGFWDGRLTAAVNKVIAKQPDPSVINLASKEYFKAVHENDLKGPVITPVFKEVKDGVAKVLSMFAKRARGAMARYIIRNRLESPHQLKSFAGDGYAYRPELSDEKSWIFTREKPPGGA
jgi:cytoplasmic iron level regulating protein YaaA (DUF328/UPF0246 family)